MGAGRTAANRSLDKVSRSQVSRNQVNRNPANRSRVKGNRARVKPRTELNQASASFRLDNRTAARPSAASEIAVARGKCTRTTDWSKAIANRYGT
jgi:hypothetical protein